MGWWKRMTERYGHLDGKDAFRQGRIDGKIIGMNDGFVQKVSKKRLKKLAKQNKKKGGY